MFFKAWKDQDQGMDGKTILETEQSSLEEECKFPSESSDLDDKKQTVIEAIQYFASRWSSKETDTVWPSFPFTLKIQCNKRQK